MYCPVIFPLKEVNILIPVEEGSSHVKAQFVSSGMIPDPYNSSVTIGPMFGHNV